MDKPKAIKQAVFAIYLSLALSAVASIINLMIGDIPGDDFVFSIIVYGLLCIIPYKINNGSNGTRYFLLVFTVIGYLMWFAGMFDDIPKLDLILSIVTIPLDIFILYKLFINESDNWFDAIGATSN